MEELTVNTWEEFEVYVESLEQDQEESNSDSFAGRSELLFRGQGNAQWRLETTLDRFFSGDIALAYYYRLAHRAIPRIQSFTGVHWKIPSVDDYNAWLHTLDDLRLGDDYQAYEYMAYMAYLRHHGFPSPLLDWTASPYVAAFFAFRQPQTCATHMSIFAFREIPAGFKAASMGEATIKGCVPYMATHRRHFLQQSQYTICTINRNGTLYYAPHEDVFKRNEKDQDVLWKISIPVTERRKVLGKLSRMNINAFSLFGSEDSLLETIAVTDLLLEGRDLQ